MVAPDGRWHPGIGDPTLLGWATVVGYFGAALLAYRALRLHQAAPPSRDRRLLLGFWAAVLCAMALLGVNKQLDLGFGDVGSSDALLKRAKDEASAQTAGLF